MDSRVLLDQEHQTKTNSNPASNAANAVALTICKKTVARPLSMVIDLADVQICSSKVLLNYPKKLS
ncbi:MAG: hypothetical protein LBH37_03890, partial [Oscillospiraceae bacterium]|nr:hypothetical protein [Oscillospiraceae bacterium]